MIDPISHFPPTHSNQPAPRLSAEQENFSTSFRSLLERKASRANELSSPLTQPAQLRLSQAFDKSAQATKQLRADLMGKETLPSDQQVALERKIEEALERIQEVVSAVGSDEKPLPSAMPAPLSKLFALLTHGEQLLYAAREQIPSLAQDQQLNPGQFLSMQLKLSVAQLNLEFCSQLLAKSSDALNKLMNINI